LVLLRPLFESDIVHISSVFYPAALFSAIVARVLGKKLVFSVHGELDPYALQHSRLRKAVVLWVVRRMIARDALFHSTCDAETAYIRDVFGDAVRIAQITNYMEVPARENRAGGPGYLLFIGRIHHKKGIENLLRALPVSSFRESGLFLKIAGKGDAAYEAAIHKLLDKLGLTDRVEFLGHVEGRAKQRLLADAFFTVMPSHTENFGVVVTESLAQGTPVIASRGTPWEILEEGGVGFWTDNSPEALANCLDMVIRLPEAEYLAMRARARPFVELRFDIQNNIGHWEEVYRTG
jgi:glycosyltransferase involved in cell wall biosynthesis